jgi:hypothetical protein
VAGILANSASATMTTGTVDGAVSGRITGEPIRLTTNPTGATYSWALGLPSGSNAARAGLDDATAAGPSFTPDIAGLYVATCTVDGVTAYTLRVAVVRLAASNFLEAGRLSPVTDAQIPTPAVGLTYYCGSDHANALCVKDSAGDVFTVDVTAV